MGISCITLCDNTERPETVEIGTNELAGTDDAVIKEKLERLLIGDWKKGSNFELWDGFAGERIVRYIQEVRL